MREDSAMTAVETYRWTVPEFLHAWEVGAFPTRVELVEGEIWPVSIGNWHGETTVRLAALLSASVEVTATMASLPSGPHSLPDPDLWVRRKDAEPVEQLSKRISRWTAADVLLVVEVSDETLLADLDIKTRVYGSAGFPVYWVVSPDVIYVRTGPHARGYKHHDEYRTGEKIPLPWGGEVAVDQILG